MDKINIRKIISVRKHLITRSHRNQKKKITSLSLLRKNKLSIKQQKGLVLKILQNSMITNKKSLIRPNKDLNMQKQVKNLIIVIHFQYLRLKCLERSVRDHKEYPEKVIQIILLTSTSNQIKRLIVITAKIIIVQ